MEFGTLFYMPGSSHLCLLLGFSQEKTYTQPLPVIKVVLQSLLANCYFSLVWDLGEEEENWLLALSLPNDLQYLANSRYSMNILPKNILFTCFLTISTHYVLIPSF